MCTSIIGSKGVLYPLLFQQFPMSRCGRAILIWSIPWIWWSMPISPPRKSCRTKFVGVFIEKPTIQLQWNPVNRSAPECSNEVQYNVPYRGCNGTSWNEAKSTTNTSIEFQPRENEIKNLFSASEWK